MTQAGKQQSASGHVTYDDGTALFTQPPLSSTEQALPPLSSSWLRRLVFLGTGTSGQIPAAPCVMEGAATTTMRKPQAGCQTCRDAMLPGSKNKRGCCSVALVGSGSDDEEESLILIDCGPTFYQSTLAYFPGQRLRRIAALLLTHAHADAILGLDSLRAWTMGGLARSAIQDYVDIYCTQECFDGVRTLFPYLVDTSQASGSGSVGALRFHVIDPSKPFQIKTPAGVPLRTTTGDVLEIIPLPVWHGYSGPSRALFPCLGFRLDTLSYVSDTHHIPLETSLKMSGSQLLVLDSLSPAKHASHFSLTQAVSMALSLPGDEAPRLALLTDLTHRLEHHICDATLRTFVKQLRAWNAETRASAHKAVPTDADESAVGVGEGGVTRWWHGAWDEARSERDGVPRIEKEALQLIKGTANAALNGAAAAAAQEQPATPLEEQNDVPDIRISWDGQVVYFERS